MEDGISPLPSSPARIRELISSLELCHHKAARWVDNIIEAIATGQTAKGLGTRSIGQSHPVERSWQNSCAVLSAWCAGCPVSQTDLSIREDPASQYLARLGQRTDLKEWQVQRVVERIHSFINWPWSREDPSADYVGILESGGEYESRHRTECPDRYKEHEDFWLTTVQTTIHDVVDGKEAELSLGVAIDMLMPCHWNFAANLEIVLMAIGGNLESGEPYSACGRNIDLSPIRGRMKTISNTLRAFYGTSSPDEETDPKMLSQLGAATGVKKWLAASLDKTIRLQLHL
jgi:hypothetical protein